MAQRCERWLWARVIADDRHIDFAVQAVPTGLGMSTPRGTAWVAVAMHPTTDRKATLTERVSDAARATPEEAAQDVRIAAEGTDWRRPWTPEG